MSETHNFPIVFLHGWGMNAKVWDVIRPELEAVHNSPLYFLDLPGFGSNQNAPKPYDLNALADWLDSHIDSPAIVLGWSLGGLVAQRFAEKFPDKVVQLGLIASTPKFLQTDQWPGIKPEVLAMFAKQLQDDHGKTIERFMAIQAMGSETAKEDIRQLKELVLSAEPALPEALTEGLNILHNEEEFGPVANPEIPVHMLMGKLDSLVPHRVRKPLKEVANNTHITLVAKASHAPFISHKQEFLEWFDTVRRVK